MPLMARLYETEEQAQNAAAKLSSELPGGTVHLMTPSSDGDAATMLRRAGLEAGDASAFAAEIAQGRSLVANNPPFGKGATAKAVLDEFGPLPMAPVADSRAASARYTPFSDLLQLPLLTKRPHQTWWYGDELIQRNYNLSFGIPRLNRAYNLSFGIPRLNRMYNLSFGIPRLNRAYNLSFGIPRLNRAYNLSFGIPRLIRPK